MSEAPRVEIDTALRFAKSAPAPRLRLHVEREAAAPTTRHVSVDGERVRVGSHPSNDLVLDDPSVSRFHFDLVRRKDGWIVRDSGSTNGTMIRGVRIGEALLPPGEVHLDVADSRVRVEEAGWGAEVDLLDQPTFGTLFGRSIAMRKLFAILERVAAHDTNVLIEGESGTGKELVATEIVRRSARSRKPLVVVDCGAISPTLIESELFGHARGAFTGADRDRTGAFEAANGGTLFLDEIGELPLELQPKLLRALEAREVRKLGETQARKVDVRVVTATNRVLEREVNEGRFREDLYFRLSVVTVRVPPLRERPEDIALLVDAFLDALGGKASAHLFSAEVLEHMSRHPWPGNVRELRTYVERAIVFHSADTPIQSSRTASTPPAAPTPDIELSFGEAKARAVAAFEEAYFAALLAWADGNISRAARKAKMDRMHLHRLAQHYGLREGRGLRD